MIARFEFRSAAFLLSVLLSLAATFAADRTADDSSTSIDSLVDETLKRNPELAFYRAEIMAAQGERKAARTWSNPELTLSGGEKRIENGSISNEGVAWSVSLRQPLEWPGRIALRKAIANRQVQLAEIGLRQFQSALAGRTKVLAHSLFAAQEKAQSAAEVADRFRALREVLVQRDPAGLTPLLETRIIEATELAMQRKASEAGITAKTVLLELNQLRDVPLETPTRIAPPVFRDTDVPSIDLLLRVARTNNFELRTREVELEQQGFKLSLARNDRFPSITIGPYYSEERAGDKERQVGIALSLPLPAWNRNGGKVASEEARKDQAATLLFVTQRKVEREILEKAMVYQAKVTEMAKWKPESVTSFKEAAALADRHYRLGAVPVSTYVELQKQYLDAVETLLVTRTEALQAASELEQLLGISLNELPKPAKPGEQ